MASLVRLSGCGPSSSCRERMAPARRRSGRAFGPPPQQRTPVRARPRSRPADETGSTASQSVLHTQTGRFELIIRRERPTAYLTLVWRSYENNVAWTEGKSGLRTHLGVEDVCMK